MGLKIFDFAKQGLVKSRNRELAAD